MNKATREAIEQKFPMRWEGDSIGGFGVKLVAITYTWENGKVRERILWRTFDRGLACIHHAQIYGFGGKVDGPGPEQAYEGYRRRQEDAWNAPENASIRAAWAAGQEMRRVRE